MAEMNQPLDKRQQLDILAASIFARIQAYLDMEEMWLPVDRYAQLHGLSPKTVRRAIELGGISEENGGLPVGAGSPRARKRVHRFFDIKAGEVVWPG